MAPALVEPVPVNAATCRRQVKSATSCGEASAPDEHFSDPTAWANITDRRYGNSGRNQSYGPGYYNINMSLFRTFQLHGRTRLQFFESFSVQNQPIWSNPNGNVTSSNFMRITSTRTNLPGDRHARFGLRLEF